MKAIMTLISALSVFFTAGAYQYSYNFNDTPISQAILCISKDHPDVDISFIYEELDNYRTSARVKTDDTYEALRQIIGLNPVSVLEQQGNYYVEALQHGRFIYRGRVVGSDNEPVAAATVMLLAPKDSTVITYGIADGEGRFSIPCDHRNVIAKLSCMGYVTTWRSCPDFNCGTIVMPVNSVMLGQVKVEGQTASVASDRSVYLPSSRQKNAARNAISLLSMMSIPQISVDPVTKAVQTSHGQDVSIFIDYVPATAEDLKGMRTQDARKVEYYLHPSDVRFQGAKYVINFVMQKYEWGGYTKLNADKWLGVNRTEGSVYSKMTYKRMTFDVFADEIYLTNRHIGQNSVEHFDFTDLYGHGPCAVTRTSETNSGLYRNNSNDLSIRALYNSGNVEISNRVAYSLKNIPHADADNNISYSPGSLPASVSSTKASSRDWALRYNGEYFFMLSKLAALNVTADYTYGHNTSKSDYSVPDELSVINNANEDVHKFASYLHLNWNPDKANQFFSNFGVEHTWNIIDYSGNSPSRQKYNVGVYFLGQNYQHIFNEKWNVGAGLAWIWETNRISGVNADNNFPQTNINATWAPNNRNQLYFTANYGSMFPNAFQKSPNMLQQDELMWYRGTPELKDYKYTNALLSYTWLPDNKCQLTSDAYFGYIKNRLVTLYSPTGPGGTMLRQYFNGGDYFSNYLSVNATAKFFDGKLIAKLSPRFWMRKATGEYAWKDNELTCTAQLTYYLGNIYFMGWYMTPSKYQEVNSGIISRSPSRYQLEIGWGQGAWNVNASAYNFAHGSWEDRKESLNSDCYSFDRTVFGTQNHARYAVSVTYTVGYGKKVQHRNETSGAGTAGSAILK